MEFEDIERILELVRQHDLAEFELERDGLKIRVRKASAAYPMPPAMPPGCRSRAADRPTSSRPARRPTPGPAPAGEDEAVELAVVKSPIVGTFYRSPEPGAASFVEIGDHVKKDQVLCIIEAMKLMNEITSEYDGEDRQRIRGERQAGAVRRAAVRDQDDLADVQEDSHRQPRGNRAAHHLRLPRARHQDRRGLFGGGRELAARAVRRRGRLHRSGAERRQLSERAGGAQRRGDHRRRRDSSRATGSCRRAPISPKCARPATSSSSVRRRTSSACSATRRARGGR